MQWRLEKRPSKASIFARHHKRKWRAEVAVAGVIEGLHLGLHMRRLRCGLRCSPQCSLYTAILGTMLALGNAHTGGRQRRHGLDDVDPEPRKGSSSGVNEREGKRHCFLPGHRGVTTHVDMATTLLAKPVWRKPSPGR